MNECRDVVVIGAGPAGSAVAALLARRGLAVLVLEKEHFPRFHIGESLLPACLPVLQELGVHAHPDTFVYKRGATFVSEELGRAQAFAFDAALPGLPRHAWHVERSRFDALLCERAAELGAEVRHGEAVVDAGADLEGAWVRTERGRVDARFVIDASGQERFTARRAGSVEPYRRFGAAAVFTHFEGLGSAAVEELGPDFDIRIVMRDEGWGWIIPLPQGRLSVGIVVRARAAHETLDRGLLAGRLVRRLTQGARRLETRVAGNFSCANTRPFGVRRAAIGDAACFLDPVFSSGVTLALRSAQGVAAALGPALEAGTEASPALLSAHAATMERGYRTFEALIDRFYNSRFARTVFLGETLGEELRRGVMSVLAGDVWRHDNAFQELLLSSRRARSRTVAG